MTNPIWLGYTPLGAKLSIADDDLAGMTSVLGDRAKELGALLSYACHEAGLRILILDTDGYMVDRISGYLDLYCDHNSLLYDAMKIDENAKEHGQLAASAYALAMNLTPVQEAILNSALQKMAPQGGVASPSALYDAVGGAEGFTGHQTDDLKGRLVSLSSLNLIGGVGVLPDILQKSAIVDFSQVQPPEAKEVAASLFIAKFLWSMSKPSCPRPDIFLLVEAHRIFRRSSSAYTYRLLSGFLASPIPKLVISDIPYILHEYLMAGSNLRIYCSGLWNESRQREKSDPILPNMYVLHRVSYGYHEVFIPRNYEPKRATKELQAKSPEADERLTKLILETIDSSKSPTRFSVASYLSPHFPKTQIEGVIDRLQQQGATAIVAKEVRPGSPIFTLTLTVAGKQLLEKLKQNG